MRAARKDSISAWIRQKKLEYLGIPHLIATGYHNVCGENYRFLVMQRFGDNIEKHFRAAGVFCEDTVCYLALRLLEALQYLHEFNYVHADVKGLNLLTGRGSDLDRVYLVDYSLAFKYIPEGGHCDYERNPRKQHNGTIELTSIDAHNGVKPSRRGDLEILGYCLLQWSCGRLPWEDNLKNKNYVARRKREYKTDVPKLLRDCFRSDSPPEFLAVYMTEVYKLEYTQAPDYSKLARLFTRQLQGRDPRKTLEWMFSSGIKGHSFEKPPAKKLCLEVVASRKRGPKAVPVPVQCYVAEPVNSGPVKKALRRSNRKKVIRN